MQILRIAHFHDYISRKGTHSLQQPVGHTGLIAGDHYNGHGFAYSAAYAQHYGGQHARLSCGKHRKEHAALFSGAQSQRAFIIAAGYGTDSRFAHSDNSRENHNPQQQ